MALLGVTGCEGGGYHNETFPLVAQGQVDDDAMLLLAVRQTRSLSVYGTNVKQKFCHNTTSAEC